MQRATCPARPLRKGVKWTLQLVFGTPVACAGIHTAADPERLRLLVESRGIRFKQRDPVEGIRRTEVKGRTRGYSIRLTTNEWYKATTGDSYWLYVVWDPLGTSPELVVIRNPAVKLDYATAYRRRAVFRHPGGGDR